MSYTIKFTDFANKGSLTVNDNTPNTNTSLTFPGRNQQGYAVNIAENFLHMLENFSDNMPPSNPVEGQLWYDNTNNIEELKVYDGSSWKPAGSIKKGSGLSPLNNTTSVIGDLYVDTSHNQLYVYSGASWILIGPTFSAGNKSGVVAEVIKDIDDVDQVILKTFVNDQVLNIFSISEFYPKVKIDGFIKLMPGQNVSSLDFSGTGVSNTKFWGVAEKAENLVSGDKIIPAASFLRKDIVNATDYSFSISNDGGLTVGTDSNLRLQVTQNIGTLYHSRPESALDLKVFYNNTATTLVRLDSNKGYVGINNLIPDRMLDVTGTGRFSGNVEITNTDETNSNSTGALRIAGGMVVTKNTRIGGDLIVSGQVKTVGTGAAIVPTGDNQSDIGYVDSGNALNNLRYRNIYAVSFKGALTGDVIGNVTGDVNGTASRLTASTTFKITGHLTSNDIVFDGSTGGTIKEFQTEITQDAITSQDEILDTSDLDNFLLYRTGVGLVRTKKSTFVSDLSLIPTGTIFPFAGITPPPGYLFCDGSEKRRAKYPDLFSVIQFIYGDPSTLIGFGTFRLPDFRGRFVLGRLDMDNGDAIPNGADNGATQIDSGGGIPDPSDTTRNRDATARTLGNSNGREQQTLLTQNLPDHTHSLKGDDGTQFYAINNESGNPTDTGAFQAGKSTTTADGQYINSTGNIENVGITSQPFNIMNPYTTINYIIFAGKVLL